VKDFVVTLLLCIFGHIYIVYHLGYVIHAEYGERATKFKKIIWIPIVNVIYVFGICIYDYIKRIKIK
jgi:uncharacterized BrkB/YihY/UPF0761 family membrane protein